MSLLKAQNISKSYNLLEVDKDISLEINSGEVVGLLGHVIRRLKTVMPL